MKTFTTENEYKAARARYDEWHTSKDNRLIVGNDETSAIEEWEFRHDIPDRYFAYVFPDRNEIGTWTGQTLGHAVLGRIYRSNMGDRRQSITVKAINGHEYYGTFFRDAGDYCRLKLKKATA